MRISLKTSIILVSAVTIFLVGIPLIALVFNYSQIQPVNPKYFPLTKSIQSSEGLFITHLCCLASLLSVAIDILMDIGAQNNEISTAIRLKERIVIFLGLFLLGAVYLSFRSWSYIADLYVAVHFAKTNSMIAAIYCAIYPELISKGDAYLHHGMSWPFCIWLVGNVFQAYSVYYDWTAVSPYIAVVQALCFIAIVVSTIRWLHLVTRRQNAGRFHFNLLTLEEFTFFVYWFPSLLYTPTATVWKIATSDLAWKNHTPENLIFQMCCHCFLGAVIIVVPGRIVRMMVELNTKTLSLKQSFVRYVSHEIRSPLNVVHAGLDIVRSEIQSNAGAPVVYISAETAAMIEDIFSASGTSIEILNDLLDYERIDSGTLKLELAWYPLPQFFEKNYSWAKMLAEKKDISLTIDYSAIAQQQGQGQGKHRRLRDIENGSSHTEEPELVSVQDAVLHVDMYKVDQVIRNLITNAVKFTPSNGIIVMKFVCEFQSDANNNSIISKIGVDAVGILRVEVTDSGEGIDPSTQSRVFGEFNQFNRNSLQGGGGSGLGLWISRRIVHMHKGFMGFKSAGLGQGSTFYFQLPLYSSATATATAGFAHDSLLLSTPTPSAALTRVVGVMPPLQDKGIPMASDTIKGSMKRRNKVFVVEQDCEVSAVTLCDDDVAAAAAAVTGGAADRVRVDTTHADDPTQHQLTREEKSDEQKKPLPMRRPSTFLPIITSSDHTSLPCSNDTTTVVPWGGGTGTGSAKHPFLAVTAPISEEECTRFLLVDDSAMNRKVMARIINSDSEVRFAGGVDLLEADDGGTAVEMLRSEMDAGRTVDFVLMDFVMIKMNGPEAAAVMRYSLQYKGPILGVTGNALPDDIARYIANGANEVITKPLTKSKLLEAISRYKALQ